MRDNSNLWERFENDGLKKNNPQRMVKKKSDLRNGKYFIDTNPKEQKISKLWAKTQK